MAKSARNKATRKRKNKTETGLYAAKGVDASRLRRRKYALSRRLGIPDDILGGSLNRVERKCGKPTCRCASGEGHPMWTLTYSVKGRRHVEFIPDELVAQVAPLAQRAQLYLEAVNEIRTINARLLTAWRRQQRARARKKKGHR